MSNQQLIKYAHVWVLAVLLAGGIVAIAVKGGMAGRDQNSNTGSMQNRNANKSGNRNTSAKGEKTGMAAMSAQDRNFLMDAAQGGMLEVELGRLATEKGATDAVKQFGQRMVDDHGAANTDLMSIATGKGITLPTDLDEKHKAHVTKLSGLTGAEFDREYARLMVSDHTKDVAEFEKQSTHGVDPDLKAFATKTLPTLQQHLQLAKALNGGSGKSNTKPSGNSNRP